MTENEQQWDALKPVREGGRGGVRRVGAGRAHAVVVASPVGV